jgi:hypothetical protein
MLSVRIHGLRATEGIVEIDPVAVGILAIERVLAREVVRDMAPGAFNFHGGTAGIGGDCKRGINDIVATADKGLSEINGILHDGDDGQEFVMPNVVLL